MLNAMPFEECIFLFPVLQGSPARTDCIFLFPVLQGSPARTD